MHTYNVIVSIFDRRWIVLNDLSRTIKFETKKKKKMHFDLNIINIYIYGFFNVILISKKIMQHVSTMVEQLQIDIMIT